MILLRVDEISSIDAIEQVQILSTFNVLHDSTFQCGPCKLRNPKEIRDSGKGCTKSLTNPFSSWRDLVKFRKCPANYYSPYWAMVIDNFRHFSNGMLPFEGSLYSQPNKIIEAYGFIESLKLEYEADIRAKQARASKRNK